jgi:hypothetical protein
VFFANVKLETPMPWWFSPVFDAGTFALMIATFISIWRLKRRC